MGAIQLGAPNLGPQCRDFFAPNKVRPLKLNRLEGRTETKAWAVNHCIIELVPVLLVRKDCFFVSFEALSPPHLSALDEQVEPPGLGAFVVFRPA